MAADNDDRTVERDDWLSRPEEEITYEDWVDALEILPPMAWETTDTYSRFLMSEMTSGSLTQQYICRKTADGRTCATKIVNACDRSTWME